MNPYTVVAVYNDKKKWKDFFSPLISLISESLQTILNDLLFSEGDTTLKAGKRLTDEDFDDVFASCKNELDFINKLEKEYK